MRLELLQERQQEEHRLQEDGEEREDGRCRRS